MILCPCGSSTKRSCDIMTIINLTNINGRPEARKCNIVTLLYTPYEFKQIYWGKNVARMPYFDMFTIANGDPFYLPNIILSTLFTGWRQREHTGQVLYLWQDTHTPSSLTFTPSSNVDSPVDLNIHVYRKGEQKGPGVEPETVLR